jgi:hypothetical protein
VSDAILGVIVGWGLATVAEMVRWWRQSRERDNERKTTIRRAARLILEELLVAEKATQQPERGDPFAFQFGGARKLPTSVWNANREVLAVAPEAADEWETVASAYARLDELNWAFEPGTTKTVDEREALLAAFPEIHTAVVEAVGALRRLIGPS